MAGKPAVSTASAFAGHPKRFPFSRSRRGQAKGCEPERKRQLAARLANASPELIVQVDTFFHVTTASQLSMLMI
jgi:hypothetical protein